MTSDGVDVVVEVFVRRRRGSDVVGVAESESSDSASTVVGGTLFRFRSRRGIDDSGTSVVSVSSSWEPPPDASNGLEPMANGMTKMASAGRM